MGQRYDWIFILGHPLEQGHGGSKWACVASWWLLNGVPQLGAPGLWPT